MVGSAHPKALVKKSLETEVSADDAKFAEAVLIF
jgi:hypothetical protein